jgi:hypothetical protein
LLTRLNAVKKQHDETMPGQANLIEDNAGNALLFNGLFSARGRGVKTVDMVMDSMI